MDSDYPNPQKKSKSHGFFDRFKKHNEDAVEEEIISMVNESHEAGNLRATEATMIQNIFEFDDKDAKDVIACTFGNINHRLAVSTAANKDKIIILHTP